MGRAAHREERATRAGVGDPIGSSTSTALFGVTTPIITAFAESIPLPGSDVGKPEVLMHLGQGGIDFSTLR
jgi:hypothetical protein